MTSDTSYNTLVRITQGGAALDVATGGMITANGAQATLVAPAATAATNSSPYGFSQAQADAIVTWIRAADAQLKALGTAV
jgi:hypothetical protein